MTKNEILAVAAGLVAGEGHISVIRRERGERFGQPQWQARVTVTNTDIRMIEWLLANFGGGADYRARPNPRHKPVAVWRLHGPKARDFLVSIRPYLVIKQEQADLIIAFQKLIRHSHWTRPRLTDEELAKREDVFLRLKTLNQKGPPLFQTRSK
jgi:hypothetical protein